jgi:hypothetical protein
MPLTHKVQRQLAAQHGRAVAKSHYDWFCKPESRNPEFKWENYPDLAVGMAEVSLYMGYRHGSTIWDELVNICKEAAREEANRLLENLNDQTGT